MAIGVDDTASKVSSDAPSEEMNTDRLVGKERDIGTLDKVAGQGGVLAVRPDIPTARADSQRIIATRIREGGALVLVAGVVGKEGNPRKGTAADILQAAVDHRGFPRQRDVH